ncbi:MAG: ankyrin repeat domain-containing protein [Alphaproteobacteria bacterium]
MSKPIPKSPLLKAAEDNELSYLQKLLAEGADVNAPQEPESLTCLMWAVMHKNEKMVETLLEKSPNLELRDVNGWTALMYATRCNNLKLTRMFLDAGADIDAVDKSGLSAGSPNAAMTNPAIPALLREYAEKREAAAMVHDARRASDAFHEGLQETISVAKPLNIKPR